MKPLYFSLGINKKIHLFVVLAVGEDLKQVEKKVKTLTTTHCYDSWITLNSSDDNFAHKLYNWLHKINMINHDESLQICNNFIQQLRALL